MFRCQGQKFKRRSCLHEAAFEFGTRQTNEDAAIFVENQQNPNVCRIAGAALLRSNSWHRHLSSSKDVRACTRRLYFTYFSIVVQVAIRSNPSFQKAIPATFFAITVSIFLLSEVSPSSQILYLAPSALNSA